MRNDITYYAVIREGAGRPKCYFYTAFEACDFAAVISTGKTRYRVFELSQLQVDQINVGNLIDWQEGQPTNV